MPTHASEHDEVFKYLSWGWNVSKAKDIVTDREEPDTEIKVAPWEKQSGLIRIDEEYADSLDESALDEPVILVPLHGGAEDGSDSYIIIDGWHRVKKASKLGRDTLDAYVLTDREERIVRDARSMLHPAELKEVQRERRVEIGQIIADALNESHNVHEAEYADWPDDENGIIHFYVDGLDCSDHEFDVYSVRFELESRKIQVS